MKCSSLYFLVITLALVVVIIEAKGKKTKHDKYGVGGRRGPSGHTTHHHPPGGRSKHGRHNHYNHHQPGGRSRHAHRHGNRHEHQHYDTYDHQYGHDYGYDQSYDHGYDRHRRDIIINGTDQNDTMSMNDTTTLPPGYCTKLISVTVTFSQSFLQTRKVPAIVRCGWLHLAKCKVYKLEQVVVYRPATRTQYATVQKCCPGFMMINGRCQHAGGRTTPTPAPTTTTPPATTTAKTTMTTTDVPDDYKVMIDDKIQKLVTAIIIILLLIFTICCIIACMIHVCKICCQRKKANYV